MNVLTKQCEMNQYIAAMDLLIVLNVLEAIPKPGSISSNHLTEVVKVNTSRTFAVDIGGRRGQLLKLFGRKH
jgi:hypothetical protein